MTAVENRRDDFTKERDPLGHWLDQERAGTPDDRLAGPDPGPLPGGWWILPALALALPTWGLIFWLLAG